MNDELSAIAQTVEDIKSNQDSTPKNVVPNDSDHNSISKEELNSTESLKGNNLPQTTIDKQSYIKPIGKLDGNDFYVTIDKTKNYRAQAQEMAEAAAVVAAVQDDTVRDEMIKHSGEQLVVKTKTEAARARAEQIEATTEEQIQKRDMYQSLLETFGAYKHYPEWLRKIVVGMFTVPYLLLLLIIGIPTGIVRFTIECIDGIFIRYDNVNETRKPKVRFITWLLLALGIVAAIVLPILKVKGII